MTTSQGSPPPDPSPAELSRETTPLLKCEEPKKTNSDTPSWQDVLVCSLAYTAATLFVLSPLRSIFGSSGSKHTVATTAVWFHPVRTQGNLIEVLYYTVQLLTFTTAVCLSAMATVKFSHFLNLPQPVNTVMLVCWLSGTLGFIGVLKVRANNQSFNTASSAAIIFIVSALLREDDAQHGALPLLRLLNYLLMVAIGATISSTTSLLFYRKTSLAYLGEHLQELSQLYADMLELLVANFGSQADPVFAETNAKANTMLSQLDQHLKFASYEIAMKRKIPWRRWIHFDSQKEQYYRAKAQLTSLQKQSMHLGGMLHCASVVSSVAKRAPNEDDSPLVVLRKLMHRFATKLCHYVKHPSLFALNEESINTQLISYTHRRDQVLRSCNEQLDNSLQATCILFAHLLQDIGDEMISGKDRISSSSPETTPIPQRSHVAKHTRKASIQFNQLTEALSPTTKATHTGFGPKLWKFLRVFRNLDVRHGIRVGFGAMILCIPAYIPEYRPTFQKWHGEWTLITYMIIMARNLGAMTKNIPLRMIGTTIGAIVGIVANELFDQRALPLFIVGFFVSFGCYYRILSKTNPVFGRFILLSYNLVCLYSFSITMDDPDDSFYDRLDPIYDIAFHRVVSVTVGVLWAVFLTLTIWPHSARQALRADLCIQWMRMGMIWKSDPLGVVPFTDSKRPSACSSSQLLPPPTNPVTHNMARFRGIASEHELQSKMLDLDVLLKNSPNEFRLRGQFNAAPYKQLLDSTQVILDAFHSISIMIDDEPIATAREQDLVLYTQQERRELCHLLFLQFYTASASVRLGFPVPEYLPEPDHPLIRLSAKISERRLEMGAPKPSGSLSQDNYDFVLFYSYMTVVLTVSMELNRIHEALREIFGSLDDDILFAYV